MRLSREVLLHLLRTYPAAARGVLLTMPQVDAAKRSLESLPSVGCSLRLLWPPLWPPPSLVLPLPWLGKNGRNHDGGGSARPAGANSSVTGRHIFHGLEAGLLGEIRSRNVLPKNIYKYYVDDSTSLVDLSVRKYGWYQILHEKKPANKMILGYFWPLT